MIIINVRKTILRNIHSEIFKGSRRERVHEDEVAIIEINDLKAVILVVYIYRRQEEGDDEAFDNGKNEERREML